MSFRSTVPLVALLSASTSAGAQPTAAPEASEAAAATRRPEISVRLDPFNWVLEGRLGLELEVALNANLSLELVPVFVTSDSPPTLNLSGREDNLLQSSNGVGPISGVSLGVGWWLDGTPFRGSVLRGILTNYGYTFETTGAGGAIVDRVDHVERAFLVFFGSYSRWGAFTLGGGLGLGLSLTRQRRCFEVPEAAAPGVQFATTECEDDEQLIALDPQLDRVANLNDALAPALLVGRLSLGVTF